MVTDLPYEMVREEVGTLAKGPGGITYLPNKRLIKFLADRGLAYGVRVVPEAVIGTSKHFSVRVSLDLKAIVTVPSEKVGAPYLHGTVWCPDRRMILDPGDDTPQHVDNYKILEWAPIVSVH